MPHALVAGGAGFIGSHLCGTLLDRGWRVTCLDNLSTGTAANIRSLVAHAGFRFLEHDVVLPLPEVDRADVVFHLASPASVPDYLARPLETLAVNSTGTGNLLERVRRDGARFLFTSTSEISGDPLVHPQPEHYWGNVSSVGPRACYDEGKRFGEALVMAYFRMHGLDARIARIFNTYGPNSRLDDGRIVPNFITQALRGEPLTVYGDGTQTRSLCYVSDLVDGIIAAATFPDIAGEVFNLGNPEEHTILEFARTIAAHIAADAAIDFRPLPVDDPTRRCPDISRARKLLGWEPHVSLDDGLDRTIGWFRAALQTHQPARAG